MKAVAIGVVVAAIAACAAPACAAFPGRDGELVVATARGLELVSPATGAAMSICADVALCGHPVSPSFSPNGRAIAFVDAVSHRPVVIAADGSCLWCLLGRPLTAITGSAATFTANGGALTVAGHGLWTIDLARGRATRGATGMVNGVVWSSRGLAAVVRGGWVWVGRPGYRALKRLVRGGAPSFSPNGATLAFALAGYVWTVSVTGGARRRLVTGGAPAWSPSGRRIAYIAPGGTVEIVAAGGGRRRTVGAVDGTAIDWQPVPASRPVGCKPPKGAVVVASDAEAVVFSPAHQDFYGCLKALGRTHLLLDPLTAGGFESLQAVKLAGRFAAFSWSTANQYGEASEDASVYDLSSGSSTELGGVSWDYNHEPPVYGLDQLALDSSGFAAWRETSSLAPEAISALSCPAPSLCVGGDPTGNIVSSTDPSGSPAWNITPASPNQMIEGTSCPSTSLCVAVDSAGNILTSTNPAGGTGAWTKATIPSTVLGRVSCPSVSLCVAVGSRFGAPVGATILTSTNPVGGASGWRSATFPLVPIGAVSCPSVSLCVATGGGDVLTSTNPTGGASTWTNAPIPGIGNLSALSCPSVSLCVASGWDTAGDGITLTTTNPTGGPTAWTQTTLEPATPPSLGLGPVSCPSASLCVIADAFGNILTSTNPTGGASTWTKTPVTQPPSGNAITTISCPSVSLCIAADTDGNVLTSTNPTGGANTWTGTAIQLPGCTPESGPCDSEQLYVRDDHGTRVIDTVTSGPATSIGNVTLNGDAIVLSWTHNGAPRQLGLR